MMERRERCVRWYYSRPVIIVALVLAYPVGVALLVRSPRPRRWEKIAAPIGFLPLFLAAALLALEPFWEFDGDMNLSGFRFDFDRLWQYRRLERQRARRVEDFSAGVVGKAAADAPRWTDFRGPRRDGVVTNAGISLDWEARPPREVYRQPIGEGYASFAVGFGRAYTLEQRRGDEAVTCYDFATGRELWIHEYAGRFEEVLGGDGPRATPTLHGDRLYALGAEGRLHCLNALTGAVLWSRNILTDAGDRNLEWGLSGSPLVIDGRVVVTGSGHTGPSVMAYDEITGEPAWTSDVGLQSYASLAVTTLGGVRQILDFAGRAIHGLDPATGAVLWTYPWETPYAVNVAQPLTIGTDRVFVSSGYGMGSGVLDITREDCVFRATSMWHSTKLRNKFSSSVYHGGYLYGLNKDVLVCLDAETGERRWNGRRYGFGSLLLVDDHLLVLSERGELALVRATPDSFEELGRIRIFANRTWNNFVVVDGRLLARNHKEMACYTVGGK
ncbi:MAG: PQQ-binding-like beta-propeller repeat protein [Phycisphaerae bacterium]